LKFISKFIPKARKTGGGETPPPPEAGAVTSADEAARLPCDLSWCLDPHALDCMLQEANAGNPQKQARLSAEIVEKDWDVQAALGPRRNALTGLDWTCVPPRGLEDDATAVEIAEEATRMLQGVKGGKAIPDGRTTIGIDGLIAHLATAILPGYALSEILWEAGGGDISGFLAIAAKDIYFPKGRWSPHLQVAGYAATEPQPTIPCKFVWHRHNTLSGDPVRGGLIRPLGWMFLFSALGVKSFVRFVEKYGLPFVAARVDKENWDSNRHEIADVVCNFGNDGGAVFGKGVELDIIAAAQSGGSGSVQKVLLDYFRDAKTRVILGQLASSAEATGMSNGTAQDEVRGDILAADAQSVACSIERDILACWTAWKYGPDAPVPSFSFDLEDEEDLAEVADTVVKLSQAGHQADPDWVESKFGIKLASSAATPPSDGTQLSAETTATRAGLNRRLTDSALGDMLASGTLDQVFGPLFSLVDEALTGLPKESDDPAVRDQFVTRMRSLLLSDAAFDSMDTRGLENLFAETFFAADANGREEAIEKITKGTP